MLLDYHVHAIAHGEYEYNEEWICRFLEKARQQELREIGFTEHDEYYSLIDFAVVRKLQDKFPDVKIRMGLEVDYVPGREEEIKKLIKLNPYDYIIGSVHFIDGWGFDHPDFKDEFENRDIDEVYEAYFELVTKAVKAGLFDVVGHIDLVKIWGHRPKKNSTAYYIGNVLDCIKNSGTVIEINTSGLRKPVAEVYPSLDVLEMMLTMDIPITLGSDAHHPDQLGDNIRQVVLLAKKTGYRRVVAFNKRKKIFVPLEC